MVARLTDFAQPASNDIAKRTLTFDTDCISHFFQYAKSHCLAVMVEETDLHRTVFHFPAVVNTNIFDAYVVLPQVQGYRCNDPVFILHIHNNIIRFNNGTDTVVEKGIPILLSFVKKALHFASSTAKGVFE